MMSRYKPNDPTRPRFVDPPYLILNKEWLREFKLRHPKYKDIPNITLKQIIYDCNGALYKAVLESRYGVVLPNMLGKVVVIALRSSFMDITNSKKHGENIEHSNLHTDGLCCKIGYTSKAKYTNFANRLWGFKGCRNFVKYTSSQFKLHYNRFIVASNKTLNQVIEEEAGSKKTSPLKPLDLTEW